MITDYFLISIYEDINEETGKSNYKNQKELDIYLPAPIKILWDDTDEIDKFIGECDSHGCEPYQFRIDQYGYDEEDKDFRVVEESDGEYWIENNCNLLMYQRKRCPYCEELI